MGDVAQTIEFSIDELQALHSAQNIAHVIKVAFLYGSDEAFHALCSLVRNAKDLSSTSKRIRREARINFYNGLVETQHPHITNFSDRSLTYLEFGAACQTFSDRWTSQYFLDELVSLAFIIDKDETGEISLEVFLNFIEDVDHAFHSNPSLPTEALEDLYDSRREKLFRYVMQAFPSLELRTKLASLASVACQLNIQPLCTLIDLVENDIDPQPEDVIGFVIQLTGTVNQGIKDIQAAEALAALEQSLIVPVDHNHITVPHHAHASSHSSHHNHNGHNGHNGSRSLRSGEISPIGSLASVADLSLSMTEHHDRLAENYHLDHSFNSSPTNHTNHAKQQSNGNHHHSVTISAVTAATLESSASSSSSSPLGIAQLESSEHGNGNENQEPLDSASLLLSITSFQNKAQEIAQVLAASTALSGAGTPTPNQDNETPGGADGSAQVECPTPSSMSNEALLEQIQLMEAELQRARLILTPSMPNTPLPAARESSGSGSPSRSSAPPLSSSSFSPVHPPRPDHQPGSAVRRSSISSEQGGGARRRFSITSEASLHSPQQSPRTPSTTASRRPSLTIQNPDWHNTFKLPEASPDKRNGTPGRTLAHSSSTPLSLNQSLSHSGLHAHHGLHSSARSVTSHHSVAHSMAHSMANASFNSTAASYTPSKLMTLSLTKGKGVGSTGKLDRSSPLAKHVDLSIFKSPQSHRRPEAKNVYDDKKQTWVPSSTKKMGASPKPDRFSTTYDLMIAREVNPVFYDN